MRVTITVIWYSDLFYLYAQAETNFVNFDSVVTSEWELCEKSLNLSWSKLGQVASSCSNCVKVQI